MTAAQPWASVAKTIGSAFFGGVMIAVDCALIASMLVVLWTRRKPAKRTFQMICFT